MKEYTIADDAALLAAVDEYATLSNSLARLEVEEEREKMAVSARFDAAKTAISERMKVIRELAEKYTKGKEARLRLFGEGRKSTESGIAFFGWRDGAATVKALHSGEKEADIAQYLLETGRPEFVILPDPKPRVNKAAVLALDLDDAQLAELRLKRHRSEHFFIEPKDAVLDRPAPSKK